MFTNLALSQENKPTTINGKTVYPLSGEELDRIYQRDVECQYCKEDLTSCKETALSLRKIIAKLNTTIRTGAADLKKLKEEKAAIQAEKEKLIAEKAELQASRKARLLGGVETGTNKSLDAPVFKANVDFQFKSGDVIGTGIDNKGYIYLRYSKTIFTF